MFAMANKLCSNCHTSTKAVISGTNRIKVHFKTDKTSSTWPETFWELRLESHLAYKKRFNSRASHSRWKWYETIRRRSMNGPMSQVYEFIDENSVMMIMINMLIIRTNKHYRKASNECFENLCRPVLFYFFFFFFLVQYIRPKVNTIHIVFR